MYLQIKYWDVAVLKEVRMTCTYHPENKLCQSLEVPSGSACHQHHMVCISNFRWYLNHTNVTCILIFQQSHQVSNVKDASFSSWGGETTDWSQVLIRAVPELSWGGNTFVVLRLGDVCAKVCPIMDDGALCTLWSLHTVSTTAPEWAILAISSLDVALQTG